MAANSQFAIAVHVLTLLARAGDSSIKSEHIAASVNTNAVVIRRLLSHLGQAHLVASHTGANGGTRLVRQPKLINLVDVYAAVGCGEVFALHGKELNQDCPVGKNIEAVLCDLQKEIDRSVSTTLAQYTLADVLERVEHA
ncbi:MAG: Rrf2 family transcriptional regulator [Pyrinomonadaceae bacterium]